MKTELVILLIVVFGTAVYGIQQTGLILPREIFPLVGDTSGCTLIVSAIGGDYNNIPDAVDSIKTTGGKICIKKGTYQLTRPIDINGGSIELWGEGVSTTIRTNPISIPVAIRIGNNTQQSNIRIKNLAISASSSLGNGTAIDASNFAVSHIEDVYINGYNRGIDFNKNNTFYNQVDNVRISVSGPNAFGIRFNNGANDNTVIRTRIITDGNGTGVLLANSHGNSLYETNVESGSAVGIDVNSGAHDTTIIGPYLEGNIINLRIANLVESTTIIGGTIESGVTANIKNNGALGLTQLGVQISFNPSRNQLTDLDLNGSLCLNGKCQSNWETPPLPILAGDGQSCSNQCQSIPGFDTNYSYSCLGSMNLFGTETTCFDTNAMRNCFCAKN